MPAGPIGASWASGSWEDTAWEVGTWSGGGIVCHPEVFLVTEAFANAEYLQAEAFGNAMLDALAPIDPTAVYLEAVALPLDCS